MNNPQDHAKNLQDEARSAASTARQGAGQAASEAGTHVRRAVDDISETAELTLEQLKEQVVAMKSDMAKLATSVGEAGYEYVGDHMGEAMSRAEKFTRERPASAWGIAAGVGFIAALILSRR